MLFGFTSAVIAGFLLTAGANWTNRAVTTPRSLAFLLLVWLLGRVVFFVPGLPPALVATVDLAFLPCVALVLSRAFIAAKSRRNFPFLAMLTLMTLANALIHAEALQGIGSTAQQSWPLPYHIGQNLALFVITLMMLVMGGRVIPMFTRNATKASVEATSRLDRVGLALFLFTVALDLMQISGHLVAGLWLLCGAVQLARMRYWGTLHAKAPLLWILHWGHAAIGGSFVLYGLAKWSLVPAAAATHLLTVGGIGGLCLGMMTRVSIGNSGRMLIAPKSMSLSFYLLALTTLVRVFVPIFSPQWTVLSYQVSGASWTVAFLLLLTFGMPIWWKPRADR
jgi:uncharacterized protein involved in response to NO